MSKRLLIVGCSATKNEAPGLMPAIDRYQGAYYQMIHQVPVEERPEIIILSALYGFISPSAEIYTYDAKLTKAKVAALLADPNTRQQWEALTQGQQYDEVLIAAGHLYKKVIWNRVCNSEVALTFTIKETTGGIGTQRGQLKAWLAEGRS